MTNFEFWINNVADMPQRDASGWFDAETGLRYDPAFNYPDKSGRARASVSILNARSIAKKFGGKALIGTAKQKEWAEKIRAEVLLHVTEDQASLLCSAVSVTGHSKFWIDNRDAMPTTIGSFIENLIAAVKIANTASRAGNPVDASLIAKIKRAQAGDLGAL